LPHFFGPGNTTHFLIRAAKTSQTAGTLCEIKIWKWLNNRPAFMRGEERRIKFLEKEYIIIEKRKLTEYLKTI
jgi:hypothetical protein